MRTEAQKRADKKWAELHRKEYVMWGSCFKRDEAESFNEVLKLHGLSKAEFIRQAIKNLQKYIKIY